MLTQLLRGTSYPFTAFGFIVHHHLLRWVLAPFLINVLLFGAFFVWTIIHISDVIHWMETGFLGEMNIVLFWIVAAIMLTIYVLIMAYIWSLIGGLVAAPFNQYLSVQSEHIEGLVSDHTTSWWHDLYRALVAELKKISFLLFLITPLVLLPLMLLHLIPGFGGVLYAILMFGYVSFATAFSFLDYVLENRRFGFREKLRFVMTNRAFCFGFGGVSALLLMIPFINVLFIPVLAVSATLMYIREPMQQKR